MRIASVRLENFGPFARLDEVRFGPLATIIGQNDAGKSHILRALQVFFGNAKLDPEDVRFGAPRSSHVAIEVAFADLPAPFALDDDAPTTLRDEMLLDGDGYLRIRKRWPCARALTGVLEKGDVALVAHDFAEAPCAGLAALKERELAERYRALGAQQARRGAKRAPREKRAELRAAARARDVPLAEHILPLGPRDALWKRIEPLLPKFELFETDTRLGVGETTFQSQFRPIVRTAAEEPSVVQAREAFTQSIGRALQGEVDQIFERLRRHTNVFAALTARPSFSWDKAVTFEILGRDQHGIEQSLDQRGSGMRRLLMVAFFQYLAEKQHGADRNVVYAVEEPENCLHPGLQRELAASFRELAASGVQVILTSHSPVFAGASPLADLVLVERAEGMARAIQAPDPAEVAEQLGIEPADQITGYNACVFVEGKTDVRFWKAVAAALRAAGHVSAGFEERRIGVMPSGGHNLKQWITLRALARLNRRFCAIVDSDRASPDVPLAEEKLRWQQDCEAQGGAFFILRKREIENYLHPAALARAGYPPHPYDEYTDVKALFRDGRVFEVVEDMTCEEILAMDRYIDDGEERHELLEILSALLTLPESGSHAPRQPARAAARR